MHIQDLLQLLTSLRKNQTDANIAKFARSTQVNSNCYPKGLSTPTATSPAHVSSAVKFKLVLFHLFFFFFFHDQTDWRLCFPFTTFISVCGCFGVLFMNDVRITSFAFDFSIFCVEFGAVLELFFQWLTTAKLAVGQRLGAEQETPLLSCTLPLRTCNLIGAIGVDASSFPVPRLLLFNIIIKIILPFIFSTCPIFQLSPRKYKIYLT